MLAAGNMNMIEIRDKRYDLVLHLVTAARGMRSFCWPRRPALGVLTNSTLRVMHAGAEDFYVAETGRRTEGIAEACALDQNTQVIGGIQLQNKTMYYATRAVL